MLVTAGHCTFGIGIDGASTTHDGEDTTAAEGGVGGTDVWVNFNEVPDFSIFPPSDSYPRDGNPQRYIDRVTALNADPAWHRGTATPHPLYDDAGDAFFDHDAGVVVFGTPVTMPKYGKLAGLDYLDRYQSTARNAQRFETVGYGLERVQGKKEFGGDTPDEVRDIRPKLDSLAGKPRDTYIVLSNGNSTRRDRASAISGGPTFDNTSSNLVVAVTSWGQSPNCGGKGGAYRLDQPDDQAFLAGFGITP